MNGKNGRNGDNDDSQDIFQMTPEEKMAMEALKRDRTPSAALEERVVAALRARGLLRPSRRRVIELTAWRIATAAAAAVVLLLCGFALGEWAGAHRSSVESYIALDMGDSHAAAMLQRAGSAYVSALQQFAALPDSIDGAQTVQGREVALVTLCAAADEAAQLVPRDELARQLLVAVKAGRATETFRAGDGTVFDGTAMIEF
jgi:hypothetical protein